MMRGDERRGDEERRGDATTKPTRAGIGDEPGAGAGRRGMHSSRGRARASIGGAYTRAGRHSRPPAPPPGRMVQRFVSARRLLIRFRESSPSPSLARATRRVFEGIHR